MRESSLVEVYRDTPLFRALRDTGQYGGRCGLCEFVNVCGGSRSRAYAVSGDPLAEEPYCTYEPGSLPFPGELAERLGNSSPQMRKSIIEGITGVTL